MKKKILKLILTLLMIFGVMGTTAFALNAGDSFVDNGIHYEILSDNKLKVTSIDNIETLEQITIPNCLEQDATTYTITEINKDIFVNAVNLKNVSIPDTIQENDESKDWFKSNKKLESIHVETGEIPNPDSKIYSIDGVLFKKTSREGNFLVRFPAGKSGEYTIPDDVRNVSNYAFAFAGKLEVLNIPENFDNQYGDSDWADVRDIRNSRFGFYNDNSQFVTLLREINVDVNNLRFTSDSGILYEKKGIDYFDILWFPGNWQGDVYTFPTNLNKFGAISWSMIQASKLKNIVCPDGVTFVDESYYVYDGCIYSLYNNLEVAPNQKETILLPNGAKFGDNMNFYNEVASTLGMKPKLKEIKVESDNPDFSTKDGILYDKTGETLVYYPTARADQKYTIEDGVKTIGRSAFYGTYYLKSVSIPESVEEIEQLAFGQSACEYVFINGNQLIKVDWSVFTFIDDFTVGPGAARDEGNLKAVYCEDTDVKALIGEKIGDKASELLFDATFEPATMNDDVELTQNEDGTVSLKWSGDSDGYEIRRYDSNKRSTYTVVGKVDGETSYTDMKVDQGVQYQYSVVPYNYYKSRSNYEDDPFKDTIQYGDEKFSKQEVYIEKTYTVKFLDKDGNLLKEETVKENESATAPEIPVIEGYTFKKWDKEFTNVQSDLEVKAIYTENKKPEIVPPNNEVVEPDHNETPPPDYTDNNDKLIFDSIVTDNGIHYDADGNKVKVDEKGNKVETSDTAMISCLTLLMLISGGYIVLKKYNS